MERLDFLKRSSSSWISVSMMERRIFGGLSVIDLKTSFLLVLLRVFFELCLKRACASPAQYISKKPTR